MGKILFISNIWYEPLAIMQLSAVVKKAGHKAELYMISGKTSLRKLVQFINKYSPDIIGFSIVAGQHIMALNIAKFIKDNIKKKTVIIFGGPYPTFVPEIINESPVDIVCRGEGEEALLDLMNTIDEGTDSARIPNLWVKREGEVSKNSMRKIIHDLNSLPFPDRELISKFGYFRGNPVKTVLASRGCPFNCSFCFNNEYRKLYSTDHAYVRRRSVENIIEELKILKADYKSIRFIKFIDDIFTLDIHWLYDFLDNYKREIKTEFVCNIRADSINEEIVKKLAEAGCRCVMFGIETGNEVLRNNVLDKKLTNGQLFYASDLLVKYKIKRYVSNMLFIPGGNTKHAWETVQINQKIRPDFMFVGIFQPYPGTTMYQNLRKEGILPVDYLEKISDPDYFPSFKDKPSAEEKNIYFFFYLLVRFPRLRFIVKLLPKKNLDLLKKLFFRLSAGIDYARLYNLTPQHFLRMSYYNLLTMKRN